MRRMYILMQQSTNELKLYVILLHIILGGYGGECEESVRGRVVDATATIISNINMNINIDRDKTTTTTVWLRR
jgi:hypothetical protein